MNLYLYDGPVLKFNKPIRKRWTGHTYAVSEAKAYNNLTYQFKMKNNMPANTKIILPARIDVLIDDGEDI